ncbi:hypothetical protein KIW84_043020 [Lathyrus oleraceus]|uniref:Protein FAR1-RELATED SEQUENCE n=1 Tax=Pisum sativum TaxID=3888 RepID=A0A9D4XE04_PEA|nr:hypothetical protein KIW84_043020 [Pisum sativum]
MDSSNIFIECGSNQGEDVEVDHGDCGGYDDDTLWVPAIGMCFSCLEEVKTYYQEYALKKGFGWRIRSSKKGDDGEVNYLILSCSREGSNISKISYTLKTLPSRAKSCPAKICIKLKQDGGHENIPFCEKDVRNYINKERRAIGKEGDGKALISYFCKMREQNTDFFYDIDLNDDFHVRNVFWADARSRAAYEYFGDVVTFDTTYLTNKYDMPFVAFVGVNHHGQSTLLGCGLLSGEDTDSFVWLFKSWLRCMLEKAPLGIATDQCKAMKNAIEIKYAMKEVVYDTFTTASFEQKWCSFIEKFDLQENDWVGGLCIERHRWASTLLRIYFWDGMSTTQHSESIHAFFDGYINSTTSLNQIVKQYDNALRSRAEKEFEAAFNSMDTTIPYGSNSSIEKQFQSEFTNAKFKGIQVEFISKVNCSASLNSMEGCFATHHVLEEILVGDIRIERVLKVVLNKENHDFKCECSLFEFRGIVCRHVLSVCSQERIISLPEKYLLTRWKKNIKRKHSYIKTSYGVTELKPQMDRFDKLCKHFYEVAEVAAESEETTEDLHETLHLFGSNMSTKDSALIEENLNDDFNPINSNRIHSPKHVKRKGLPPSKRKTFVAETIAKRSRKRTKNIDHTELTTECNIGMVENQFGSNICVESSLEVVNGEHYLDSIPDFKTMEIAFSDLVNTFMKLVNESLTLLDAVPDYKTREIAVSNFKTREIAVPDLVNTFHEVG